MFHPADEQSISQWKYLQSIYLQDENEIIAERGESPIAQSCLTLSPVHLLSPMIVTYSLHSHQGG